jgi:hypothetical protein
VNATIIRRARRIRRDQFPKLGDSEDGDRPPATFDALREHAECQSNRGAPAVHT